MVRGVPSVISVLPLNHVKEGGGDPEASHRNVALWPMETEMESGATVGVAGEENNIHSKISTACGELKAHIL